MIPVFAGVDGLTYGPFWPEDVATIPEINARGLFKKDAIVAVNVGGKSNEFCSISPTAHPSRISAKRKRQSYSSVEAYLECQVERRRVEQIFDGREVRKIAQICRLHLKTSGQS